MKSLYVHFPFCETKCHYCDFYSLGKERTKPSDPDLFAQALRKECELAAGLLDEKLDTIFFGGGTPSMTDPKTMAWALEPLQLSKRIHSETEWTMEANPSSIELTQMRAYRAMGINRVSMGVQAMRDDLLLKLGRVHSQKKALEALEIVFNAGFENVSTDLLCGVPGQTLADLKDALSQLSAFPITHLSCYLLTLPKHHRMFADLPGEEEQLAHLLFIHDWMSERGFSHYEISNFARPEKRARHNLNYWQGSSYLGLGPSAHSFDAPRSQRSKNVSSLHKYAELLMRENELPVEWRETLTASQRQLEQWMLALRLDDGFPLSWIQTPPQLSKLEMLEREGLVENHPHSPGRKRLTPRGFALSDQVIAALA